MYLVRNIRTDEYRTLRKKDLNAFYDLQDFFGKYDKDDNPVFNFEVIQDEGKIKEIVKEHFNSRGRGEEYNANMPSVSQIASKLYPLDLKTEKYLLRWQNNEPIEVISTAFNNESLSRGTYIHKILELFVSDKCARDGDTSMLKDLEFISKNKNNKRLQKRIDSSITNIITHYCTLASVDDEILHKIPDFEIKRVEYEELAHKVLPEFIKNQLIHVDAIYSEVFIKIEGFVQGSIDLVGYKDGVFSILDYKTTSTLDRKTGKRKFKSLNNMQGYVRQLALYYELLRRGGYLQSGEFPKFFIYMIHLVGGDYKVFDIPQDMVKQAIKQNKETLDWYWRVVNS